MPVSDADRERFFAKVQKGLPGQCWRWTGTHNGSGRGRFHHAGRRKYASWFALLMDGRDQPHPDYQACHTCNNKNCVNPEHLYWGTRKDNARDAVRDKCHRNSRKTHCAKGHSLADALVHFRRDGRSFRVCRICNRARTARQYQRKIAKGGKDGQQ